MKRAGLGGLQSSNKIIGALPNTVLGRPQRPQTCSDIERTRILLCNVSQEQSVGDAVVQFDRVVNRTAERPFFTAGGLETVDR
jgi:hypothetical protein